ncbi:hypothetical protein SAMN05421810_106180 [Amycolatopsis arida]|uniref:Transmembrane protein n=1 Tax=Amycolatopsis arida TaxID=587909 RepID=A0A1I5XP82_9PSEU|nr:hypothetical protein [Amycolatopsis arida]TDX97338.1 hypothetical protein CLV69_102441 [Amycolatopsis arida]SFQ33626.1 hypothetical protein SAMN05421810_106180 [Amycolatopsis arida]
MSGTPSGSGDRASSDVDRLAADVDAVVSRAARTVELGRRGFVIAVATFALIVGLLLPWVGDVAGWQVLAGEGGAVPRLFAATSTAFGVIASALALATRRWWLTWVCAVGGWFASVDGVLAIWSQQSSPASGAPGAGPGIGMVLALVAMIVLAAQWMRTAWSRT